ncbi:MAG: hypothetical protein ACJ8G2_16300 [Burkholderiales bacterium]|jgi:hypothetical protein
MLKKQSEYEQVMNDAVEHVYVYAVRQAMDTRKLIAQFDAGRGPGPHEEHTLTISVRDSDLSVAADNIPHEWLAMGTGYIDMRFSKRIAALLQELDQLAQKAGQFI